MFWSLLKQINVDRIFNITMKKLIFISIFIFGTLGCSEDQFLFSQEVVAEIVKIEPRGPVSLSLVNQLEDNFSITSWSMVGYEFKNLDIQPGGSNLFVLADDMPEGYKDINITVDFSSSTGSFSVTEKVNFIPHGITKITISGCEVCGGPKIESSW